ncbi:SDR family NAD(P)-dependent oxidoreductase [Mucilaginibacter jinjuensis]|uniref:SDR family NAD(P)-dependent oxidoreductase n=1 Tax=Mucilaginibacter jinjuensis TaxID=1176721 RepID=A0ABY7TD41_9SPHI|nr:SDR family NAD(P)-dependent oxidoreductase [Mucilaginibacter jinjuensis]WCT14282.1 SDR family NAD(P)-dependent oxidoreductase [Mucilaginibacter jinjuensis]
MNFKEKKVLITGGSSGIGKVIIAELVSLGTKHIAVVGRDPKKFEQLRMEFTDISFLFFEGNVAELDIIKQISAEIQSKWAGLDILINNAGVVSAGKLEDISDEDIIAQQNINVTGLILLTKYCLPLLKLSSEAAIINVSSGLGIIGLPFYAPYAATKAAVRQFSEAVRRELQDYPIHVMTVYPTATDTPMMTTANTSNMDTAEAVAKSTIEGLQKKSIDVFRGGEQMLNNRILNFQNPLEYDEKVKGMYEAMSKRASQHRAM